MKNLIKAIEQEEKNRLEQFILRINQEEHLGGLESWSYRDLIPNGKSLQKFSFDSLKAYLIGRKQKAIYKEIERQTKHVNNVFSAGELVQVKISMDWKKNRTWGANPT